MNNPVHQFEKGSSGIFVVFQIHGSGVEGLIADNSHRVQRFLYLWFQVLLNKRSYFFIEVSSFCVGAKFLNAQAQKGSRRAGGKC